jgi:threonine dehydratase
VISLDDVLAARAVIAGRLHRTPTFSSGALARAAGVGQVHLKAELFQRTGSFKPRGVLNRLAALTPEERTRGVATWSAGNHAAAVAYAAAAEGLDCLVHMWQGANPFKVALARSYGATVDLEAADPADSYERLLEMLQRTGRVFIHPWDDDRVMAGHGTVGLEVVEDVPDVDVVVVGVGGAGLIAGVATAVKGLRPGVRIVGVEPEGSPALSAALAAGRQVRVETKTIAEGLAPPFAGERCIEVARERVDEVILVSDEEIAEAMRFLYARAKLACEPSGAAATAALLTGRVELAPDATVAVVVSGGNVAPETASGILANRS